MKTFFVAVVLALACFALHHGSLQAGWSFDDPAHLRFAAEYSPWQYFSVREVMLQQSYAHITPWNVLFYEIGLPWAGLDPLWHHAHLLVVLWAISLATWALLRRWVSTEAALVGALLFLAMPTTASVAFTLMTAHYAYGLLFSILAIHAWSVALDSDPANHRGRAIGFALLAAAFYALACLCKELYAPLPAVMLLLPSSRKGWSRRLSLFVPTVMVAFGYLAMRAWLFGGMGTGGYARFSVGGTPVPSLDKALHMFFGGVREMLFGQGAEGWVALAVAVAWIALAVWRGKRPSLLFTGACLVALLLPVVPMVFVEFDFGHHRLLFAIGWALVVLLAWQFDAFLKPVQRGPSSTGLARSARSGRARAAWAVSGIALVVVLASLLVVAQRRTSEILAAYMHVLGTQYAYLTQSGEAGSRILLPYKFERLGYLEAMAQATRLIKGSSAVTVVDSDEALVALGPDRGRTAVAWAPECGCLRPLGADYDRRVADFQRGLAAAAGLPLTADVRLEGDGRAKLLSWKVSGQTGRVWLDTPLGRIDVPAQGSFPFGIDNTLPFDKKLPIRVNLETASGAHIRSPELILPLAGAHEVTWKAGLPVPRAMAVP